MAQLEDNQRTSLAIVLSILILLFYSQWVLSPYKPAVPPPSTSSAPSSDRTAAPQPTSGGVSATTASSGAAQAAAPGSTPPALAELSAAPKTIIESENYRATLSHLGGRLLSFTLKGYKDHLGDETPLDMVSHKEGTPLPLGVYSGDLSDARVAYTVSQGLETPLQVASGEEKKIVLTGVLPNGARIEKSLTFSGATYKINVQANVEPALPQPLFLDWSHYASAEKAANSYNPAHFTVLGADGKIVKTFITDAPQSVNDAGPSKWVSYGDYYFMAALVPLNGLQPARIGQTNEVFHARIGGSNNHLEAFAYVGPKTTTGLSSVGYELDRNIDLGWFSFLAHPLLALIRLFYSAFGNYGLAIILLTLLIKTLFLPLTKASMASMKAMQELQPEMKALRERIKDPAVLNQEIMALYKKRGVNPMGGCLPMLIQLPVFLGLYNALLNSIELRHAPFALWINDLSSPEALYILGIPVPVMVLLMGASMFIQQWLTPSAADPQQKKIMMMMPVIFTIMFIIFPMPAGLVLYWLVNNIISIIQQVYLQNDKKATPLQATAVASFAIFSVGFVLTLLG